MKGSRDVHSMASDVEAALILGPGTINPSTDDVKQQEARLHNAI
jgi:hypothetical protein